VRFLQQEHFADIVEGEKRILDLLAEVRLAGNPTAILINIEVESTSRSTFSQRLFFYFSLLHKQHLKSIYPLALFTYDKPKKPAKSSYSMEVADLRVLDFQFKAIQLNRLDWRAYLNQPNPVAAALMAKMDIAPGDRPKVKAECLRLLVTLKLDPAKTLLISSFVDTYLRMDQAKEKTFQAEIATLEPRQQERIMEVMTSWEEKGATQMSQAIALKLLKLQVPVAVITEATGLTVEQLQALPQQAETGREASESH
jgi:hypothetical protein